MPKAFANLRKYHLRGFMLPSLQELRAGAVILVDKPLRWTSFDVIGKLRRPLGAKIGHAGTLDPLATGLLICCTGAFTKRIETFQKQPKEYTGVIMLGATTPTYDLESEPGNFVQIDALSEDRIRAATAAFTGEIMQRPPIHSAIKKDGKRAYELARAGKEIELAARRVTITEFDITGIEDNRAVHFRVACSTGTYIRSLANDFGAALGVGGYLAALRRTKIGDFGVEEAKSVEEWIAHLQAAAAS